MDSLNCYSARVAKGELMPIYIAINGSWVEVNENYTTPHNYDSDAGNLVQRSN